MVELPEFLQAIDWATVKSHLPFISLMANGNGSGEQLKTPMWTRIIEIALVLGAMYGALKAEVSDMDQRYEEMAHRQEQLLQTIDAYEQRTDNRLEQMQTMLWQIHQGTK